MSRAEFIRFLGVLEENASFRQLFAEAEPEEILRLADQNGFDFSDKSVETEKDTLLAKNASLCYHSSRGSLGRLQKIK